MPYKDIEIQKAKQREWRLENPNYNKEWIEKHPNYYKEWRENHPGYCTLRTRKWVKEHPGYMSKAFKKRYVFLKKSGAMQALWKVRNAIKKGELLSLKKHYVLCADCGKRAIHYDHRDYSKPLQVEPVCCSCNLYRGSAVPINRDIKCHIET